MITIPMPARKPVMIGAESSSAIQPRRSSQTPRDADADHHREDPDELDVVGAPRGREHADPGGEQRGDRRVGANRDLRTGAEQRKHEAAGDEGVEAGYRGHAGKPRGRELLRHRDHEQCRGGHQVGRQPLTPVTLERRAR